MNPKLVIQGSDENGNIIVGQPYTIDEMNIKVLGCQNAISQANNVITIETSALTIWQQAIAQSQAKPV